MLEQIRSELISLIIDSNNENWVTAEIKVDFPPFLNKGCVLSQIVKDNTDRNIRLIRFSDLFKNSIYEFIFKFNQEGVYNQFIFKGQRDRLDEATIDVIFNKEVEDAFENNLPKSIRGKTIPWWKNPEETKDLV